MTTRPLKQGGLAAPQADVAAADIAALLGAPVDVQPYRPFLQGVPVTGKQPAFLQRRPRESPASEVSSDPLWWPPQKVAGRYLAPYLDSLGASPVPGRSQ